MVSSDVSPTAIARRILDANSYATLATGDAAGRPWATPVWFAERELREYFWVSRMTRHHSHNIEVRPEISLVVFDSSAPVGTASAVYVEADAAVVPDADFVDALGAFNAASVAADLRPWAHSAVSGDAPHRLYRARASQVWVLDESENRVPLF